MKLFEFVRPGFRDRRDINDLMQVYGQRHAPDFYAREETLTNRIVQRTLRQERRSRLWGFCWYLLRGVARKISAPLVRWGRPYIANVRRWAIRIVSNEQQLDPLPPLHGATLEGWHESRKGPLHGTERLGGLKKSSGTD